MKVIEEGTDRSAEVHFYVEGSVDPLEEYGEYVAADYAVCCYVPVEEGNKPKISVMFTGTTKDLACDAFVDGVQRKSFTNNPKEIQHLKKKIDFDSFLFTTKRGTINSQILVAPLDKVTTKTEKSELDSRETIGTIELRLYVTRQLDIFHEPKNTKYDSSETHCPDADRVVYYNRIPPTFQLDAEENSAPLSKNVEGAFKRRLNSQRPGREPWAVFRFHYRSEEALDEPDLQVTFDVKNKKLTKPRVLPLEPAPPLVANVEIKQSGKGGSNTPFPFPTETLGKRENSFLNSPTPVRNNPNICMRSEVETHPSVSGGDDNLQHNVFKSGRVGTEGVDSPTSVSTRSESKAATEIPTDKNSNHESTPLAALSTKRTLPTIDTSPYLKRPKLFPISLAPSEEPLTPQNRSVSDRSETIAYGNRFFDYRKKLADLRKIWLEKEKELAAISKDIENYKLCMNDELNRIRQEVLDEEYAFTEETKHCSNDIKKNGDL